MHDTVAESVAAAPQSKLSQLRQQIENAAHLLPAQGPITVFVHHNTLHAFENLAFEEAVVEGAKIFGCHPYLPEHKYRQMVTTGRIRQTDLEAVLMDDLDDGDVLLGFLGTRYHLRLAMLAQPLLTGPATELSWVVSETDALRRFREETPQSIRDQIIGETRHWVMRDLRVADKEETSTHSHEANERIRRIVADVFARFDQKHIEAWTENTWEAFCLHVMWQVCREGVCRATEFETKTAPRIHVRLRDQLFDVTGNDSDQLVHDALISFCAAFLDQGFSQWPLPNREAGIYQCFIALYRKTLSSPERWLRGLRAELNRLAIDKVDPLESISDSLGKMGIGPKQHDSFIRESLLALRGFAGMIWQMESRGDRVAIPAPAGSLVEFLAIRLLLDRMALAHVARESLGYRGPLCELSGFLAKRERENQKSKQPRPAMNGAQSLHRPLPNIDQRTYLLFELAQVLGWQPATLARLSRDEWKRALAEIEAFSSLERRRIYHLAFERRFRQQTLDAVATHCQTISADRSQETSPPNQDGNSTVASVNGQPSGRSAPTFQVICCIDEREESFRRHIEEIAPDCETLAAAGFFSVAIYYRGAADAHFSPLCPVIIKPQHFVREDVVYSLAQMEKRRKARRRAIGTVTHRVHVGSRTFSGGILAAVLGSLASLPLVMRILFPRATAQLRKLVGQFVRPPVVTQLRLERTAEQPGPEEESIGYSTAEMANIVERLLSDLGMRNNTSRLVIMMGHGSSSMNNPHEAAHDCGACGGGRGGPNARAFAQMANDARVRELLMQNGLNLSPETVFVGAYHNTCDESVSYYDLDRLPASHRADFEEASQVVDEARKRNAHERCRRFNSAELSISPELALRHVEGRAEDLSQVRPEYGHATNAICFVGQRKWSRGLFLDRRAFLQSYDPAQDDASRSILTRILQAVIPVCAGINLEYYFSFVDPVGYGCGTKLPHNITSLLGVMNGAASDLRPGLPWQMVEIHEPVRLLFVIETEPAALLKIMEENPGIAKLVQGNWVQLATLDAQSAEIQQFKDGQFMRYKPETTSLPIAVSSIDWYRGWREHLEFAEIR